MRAITKCGAIAFLLVAALVLTGAIWPRRPGGGGGPPQLFTENCANITEWTDASNSGAVWKVTAATCEADITTANAEAGMLQGPLSTTSEFCSFKISSIQTTNTKIGCIFRAPGTPGTHYTAYFNNQNENYGLENHTDGHGFNNDVTGTADCVCNTTAPNQTPIDLGNGDWAGIILDGTGTGTSIVFYDFGSGKPSDMTDPSGGPTTWVDAAEIICTCDAGEVEGSDLAYIDVAGDCGPEATDNAVNVKIDDFACGDTP